MPQIESGRAEPESDVVIFRVAHVYEARDLKLLDTFYGTRWSHAQESRQATFDRLPIQRSDFRVELAKSVEKRKRLFPSVAGDLCQRRLRGDAVGLQTANVEFVNIDLELIGQCIETVEAA